jgi:hypothetical protein
VIFRATRDYGTDRMTLAAGQYYELDDETAAQIERDSAGTLVPLTDSERADLDAALAEASDRAGVEIRPDFAPGPPRRPEATGGGPVMHSGSMWGGR